VLHRAWATVRSSGLASDSERTKQEIRQFEADWLNNLEKLRDTLKKGAFTFTGEKGVTPPKGKGKLGVRPIVVAPIANRIVRRALLEVLQGYGEEFGKSRRHWAGVAEVRAVMATPTSIGGIANRGVPHGLALIDKAVRAGNYFFVRSDIRNFFTRIPKKDVNAFVRAAVADRQFCDLFAQALETNLENEEELRERHLFKLFPDMETGVAQGSALSALAGNIALRKFDANMNGRGILCIRYIDDFILLGLSEVKVQAAYRSAKKLLNDMGMDVYELHDMKARAEGKVDDGNIHDGTDVLGYRISASSLQPCAAACRKFLEKVDKVVADARREMRAAANGTSTSHISRYYQSMVQLHKITWGWSQSFRHTTARHVFEQLDREIDKRIWALRGDAYGLVRAGDARTRRRVMGLHLLSDTLGCPLPEISAISEPAFGIAAPTARGLEMP
jgi:hypothetical protein